MKIVMAYIRMKEIRMEKMEVKKRERIVTRYN